MFTKCKKFLDVPPHNPRMHTAMAPALSRATTRSFGLSFENIDNRNETRPRRPLTQRRPIDDWVESSSYSRSSSSSSSGFSFSDSDSPFTNSRIAWDTETLIPFQKDFYMEHPSVAAMSQQEVEEIRDSARMTLFGDHVPKPFRTFEESAIPQAYLEPVARMGISEPTPIQQQGIPMALSGRDVVGISRTGSGKTLSYLLPAMVHINAQEVVKSGQGPIALVLAPTRELTMQIASEIQKFASSSSYQTIRFAAVYGGADRHRQISALRGLPEILVATPGRLLDLLSAGETNFKRCTYVVLDEADRMLDMGFRPDIEKILSYIRPDRQMLMWSATWPQEIQAIANKYMRQPIRVQIGDTDLHANQNINQFFRAVENWDKENIFMSDIDEIVQQNKKCLVFCNTKRMSNELERMLQSNGVKADAIHGDKTQARRDSILSDFRRKKGCVLIATDVVARGIDIRDIDAVLVFDFPSNVNDYVHRIGRTGRGNDKGLSLSYLNRSDVEAHAQSISALLKKAGQEIPQFLRGAGLRVDVGRSDRGGQQMRRQTRRF